MTREEARGASSINGSQIEGNIATDVLEVLIDWAG